MKESLAAARAAESRLLAAVQGLTDEEVAGLSRLPDWTRGHVLTHLARNADSHVRRLVGALRGQQLDQYPGGPPARAAAIEAGAHRPAAELIADLTTAVETLMATWAAMTPDAWGRPVDTGPRTRLARRLVWARRREVEIHLVDLDIGVEHRQWPADFVREMKAEAMASLRTRLAPDALVPKLRDADLVAWMVGRLQDPALPELPPWGR